MQNIQKIETFFICNKYFFLSVAEVSHYSTNLEDNEDVIEVEQVKCVFLLSLHKMLILLFLLFIFIFIWNMTTESMISLVKSRTYPRLSLRFNKV